jgi:hypothetical protein
MCATFMWSSQAKQGDGGAAGRLRWRPASQAERQALNTQRGSTHQFDVDLFVDELKRSESSHVNYCVLHCSGGFRSIHHNRVIKLFVIRK